MNTVAAFAPDVNSMASRKLAVVEAAVKAEPGLLILFISSPPEEKTRAESIEKIQRKKGNSHYILKGISENHCLHNP